MPEIAGTGTAFPWAEAMHVGLGVLRLSPAAFWAMTPREFAAAVGAGAGSHAPMPRAAFAALMQQFPDA